MKIFFQKKKMELYGVESILYRSPLYFCCANRLMGGGGGEKIRARGIERADRSIEKRANETSQAKAKEKGERCKPIASARAIYSSLSHSTDQLADSIDMKTKEQVTKESETWRIRARNSERQIDYIANGLARSVSIGRYTEQYISRLCYVGYIDSLFLYYEMSIPSRCNIYTSTSIQTVFIAIGNLFRRFPVFFLPPESIYYIYIYGPRKYCFLFYRYYFFFVHLIFLGLRYLFTENDKHSPRLQ